MTTTNKATTAKAAYGEKVKKRIANAKQKQQRQQEKVANERHTTFIYTKLYTYIHMYMYIYICMYICT